MTYTSPDLRDLHATLDLCERPRYASLPDPHDNPAAGVPAIRFVNYMGDTDDYYATNLVGPYPDTAARDADLRHLRALPLGAPEYHGGYEFLPAAMVPVGWDGRATAPEQVAKATTVRGFFAAFFGWDDEDQADTSYPGQEALFT